MRRPVLILVLCIACLQASSQYYLRGIVQDEKGNGLYNIKIFLHSKGTYIYYTGISGAFGIPVSVSIDTIILQALGYESLKTAAYSNKFNVFALKVSPSATSITRHKLISFTKDETKDQKIVYYHGSESYSSLVENIFVETDKYPETGFTLNIDKASYSNTRRFLNIDLKVPQTAVRIEEMLNYFNFSVEDTDTSLRKFTCNTQLTSSPWSKNQLLFINLRAPYLNLADVPPANLIFLIDVSGSMDQPNRLPLLKSAFKLLIKNLREKDTVSMVIYGGNVGILLQPTSGAEKDIINAAIDKLSPGGDTPGEAAIKTAYALAERTFNKNANNRVILATDGDFNVGQTSDKEFEDLIAQHKQSGIYLTCLGVGMGNYKDSKLEVLAKKGNGNFAYIDNLQEAEKIMVTEFTKTLYAVADEAYASISFNPAKVKEYRLIGFDNKTDALEDSISELEGGEVGTGHSLIAVFEIVPADKSRGSDISIGNSNIALLKLHYKIPENKEEQYYDFNVPDNFTDINGEKKIIRFAAAVIMFGELLKQSEFAKNYNWDDIIKLAKPAIDTNNVSQVEFLTLVEKAKKIYSINKKKRREKISLD